MLSGGVLAPAAVAATTGGIAVGAGVGTALGRSLSSLVFREGSSRAGSGGGQNPASSWGRQYGLNGNSPTTQNLYSNRGMKVDQFISRFRKGGIREVFPSEYMNMTVDEALQQGGSTVRKLLVNGRFVR
jgi:hypothetical protein